MDELLKKGLGKTGDHMNVPVDVASLVQQPAQVANLVLGGPSRFSETTQVGYVPGLRPAQGDHGGNRWALSTW
jgi:hypothetical protein